MHKLKAFSTHNTGSMLPPVPPLWVSCSRQQLLSETLFSIHDPKSPKTCLNMQPTCFFYHTHTLCCRSLLGFVLPFLGFTHCTAPVPKGESQQHKWQDRKRGTPRNIQVLVIFTSLNISHEFETYFHLVGYSKSLYSVWTSQCLFLYSCSTLTARVMCST